MSRGRRTAMVALLLALAGCSGGTDAVDQGSGTAQRFVPGSGEITEYAPAKRVTAPDISGNTLTGERFSLGSERGKVVVINFWGSWCAPCRAEADDLERVYTATKASGVEFLGVNVKDTRSRAVAYDRSFGISYRSLYDQAGRVALQLRAAPPNAIPATIVVDRKGRIAAVFRKALLDDELKPVVSKLATEQA
jgi:thiol-disulfide isomerase/thioredoxin